MDNENLLEMLNGYMKTGTIWEALNISIVKAQPDLVIATMPISPATSQQAGFLHAGAVITLAESLATLGTALNINPDRQMCFGLALTANHFRSRRDGVVSGEATILYKARTSMVWDVKIIDQEKNPVSAVRCTVEIVDRPPTSEDQMKSQLEAMTAWDSFVELPRFW